MSSTTADGVQTLTSGLTTLPRVNLLPPEVHQARALHRMKLGLAGGVAVVAVVLAGVYFTQVQSAHSAAADLVSVRAEATTLQSQKQQYTAVPTTINAIESAESARQSAMADDVEWYRYLNDLSYITPKNTWLTNLTIALSSSGAGSSSLSTGAVGTITVSGDALNHTDVAAWLDAAAKEHGWNNAYFSNSAVGSIDATKIVTFSSTVNVTPAALSHRYDRKGD